MALTPLAVGILALVAERPMHPYEMYSLMLERRQDRLLKLRPGSLYHTVDRLARDKFIEATGTERAGARPERTTYEITSSGEDAMHSWIRQTLSGPYEEFPRFPVALTEAHNLPRDEVAELLSAHLQTIDQDIELLESGGSLARCRDVPEMYWLDVDYVLAVRRAQRQWIADTIERIKTGDLLWHRKPQH
ncbi:PadR family transcriptional regulator [Microlunatus sp. Gsoil 973]|jgi:DNA-binding PadR family transcriptional regulator|uniref:PadR family transcriptional regulator n=1 Tax=Microlunatus sp. Gsoil 973 TaxID=2672569 RepID=UPI0012B4F765|nr:PadR family transcriptional regulator [Microlunatus sp. Gsoil 973]QGN33348.1 PadR family transcriptional regulator [Microlunatus sp. Gsoil 973]